MRFYKKSRLINHHCLRFTKVRYISNFQIFRRYISILEIYFGISLQFWRYKRYIFTFERYISCFRRNYISEMKIYLRFKSYLYLQKRRYISKKPRLYLFEAQDILIFEIYLRHYISKKKSQWEEFRERYLHRPKDISFPGNVSSPTI